MRAPLAAASSAARLRTRRRRQVRRAASRAAARRPAPRSRSAASSRRCCRRRRRRSATFARSARSVIVCRSAIAWQGCSRSVSPLITGIVAAPASSSTSAWSKVRATIASTQRDRLRATSAAVSRVPMPTCSGRSRIAWPPSWRHARLEGHVRAQRRLLEVHRERAAAQRLRRSPRAVDALQLVRAREDPAQLVGRPVGEREEVLRRTAHRVISVPTPPSVKISSSTACSDAAVDRRGCARRRSARRPMQHSTFGIMPPLITPSRDQRARARG